MSGNPYHLSSEAINDLHDRLREKQERLFPDYPPFSILQRVNRELSSLWNSPCTYLMLIADDAMKALRKKGIDARLTGQWEVCYCAYLMDMIPEDPVARGLSAKALIKDGYIDEPVQIAVASQHAEECIGLLKEYAHAWGFWLQPQEENTWLLISYGFRADDRFSRYAPKLVAK